jgi:DMSO/TMAO reductase YedYZ heme-binding membrane subunit
MKTYIRSIQLFQKISLGISVLIMLVLPLLIVFYPDSLSERATLRLYDISHIAVFLVMVIRPLADIFTKSTKIRPLVILRKGVGVLSASIIVSFLLAKIIVDPSGYFGSLFTEQYWSFENLAILAHLGDLSAIFLIITSNNLSKRILGAWWKRIQRLSYVYFYASSLYVLFIFSDTTVLLSMIIVTVLTYVAYVKNKKRRVLNPQTS